MEIYLLYNDCNCGIERASCDQQKIQEMADAYNGSDDLEKFIGPYSMISTELEDLPKQGKTEIYLLYDGFDYKVEQACCDSRKMQEIADVYNGPPDYLGPYTVVAIELEDLPKKIYRKGDHKMRFLCVNGEWRDNGKPTKTFPLQKDKDLPWVIAEEAYKEYKKRYGSQQSLERLAERGGFGQAEIAILLFQRIQRIEQTFERTLKTVLKPLPDSAKTCVHCGQDWSVHRPCPCVETNMI